MILRFSIIFYILVSNLYAENFEECKWDNKNKISCIKIIGSISNESKYSRSGINKLIINKKNFFILKKSPQRIIK